MYLQTCIYIYIYLCIHRSYLLCSEGNRKTIEKIDVDNIILKNEEYDFFSLVVEKNPEKE
jgi:histone H3/H4